LEIDSFMAATHILPQLMSAALINATTGQPGWREARKVAGRAYAEVTSPTVQLSEPKTLRSSAILNRENVVRVMDGLLATMQALRNDIDREDGDALEDRLNRAYDGRQEWWQQRQAAEWSEDTGSSENISVGSEIFGRLLGIRRRPKNKNQ
jgi:prephenate dehydrogenase